MMPPPVLSLASLLSAALLGTALAWQSVGALRRAGRGHEPVRTAASPPASTGRLHTGAELEQPLEVRLARALADREADTEMARLVGRLAEKDPAAAAAWVQRHLSGRLRTEVIHKAISRWAVTAPESALEWIAAQPAGDARDAALRALLPVLARRDGELGAMLASALDAGPLQEDLLAQAVGLWASLDPAGAAVWIEKAAPPLRDRARAHLVQRWAEHDPQGAATYAEGLPAGKSRIQILGAVGIRWSTTSPDAAVAWALALPDATTRQRVLAGVASAWAEREPRRAASLIASLPAGPVRGEALAAVVSSWSLQDPRGAGDWLSGYSGPGRDQAIRAVAWQWARQEIPELVAWRDSLPARRERDACALTAAAAVLDRQPEVAARWNELIEDQTRRREQMERISRRWLKTDPAAARAWIAESALPPAQKAALGG